MPVALFFFRLNTAGGAERIICWLAGALVERGFRVLLISLDAPDAKAFYPLHPSVHWEKLGFRSGFLDKIRRVHSLTQILKFNNVQSLIGFVISGDRTVYAAAKLAGVKLIVAERNASAMYWLRYSTLQRWMSFTLMHLADYVTVQMPSFVSGYPRRLHDRIVVISNPVPIANQVATPAIASESGRYVLLAVSRLDNVQKRIACLIRAFARAAADCPTWDLRIVGDGPEGAALSQLVAEYGLIKRISILPALSDIFNAYSEAHLFVMPSLWEGFPNALAEALAHGLPAVGFANAVGVSDLIEQSGGGWLADGLDDDKTLTNTLALAMADGEERTRRGELARHAMIEFSPPAQLEQWVKLLRSF